MSDTEDSANGTNATTASAESPPVANATAEDLQAVRVAVIKLNTDKDAITMAVEAFYNLLPTVGFTRETFIELGDAADAGPREMKYLSRKLVHTLYNLVADYEDERVRIIAQAAAPKE